jgi:hypothetical protein
MPVYHLVLEHQLTVQSFGADHRVQSVAQDRENFVLWYIIIENNFILTSCNKIIGHAQM